MISVLIFTRNEELDLPRCLASVAWSDDITVVDAASTDTTAEIARRAGAIVVPAPRRGSGIFGGDESALKNEVLATTPFKYPWVLHLDADECATPELVASIRSALSAPAQFVAYNIRRRDYMGSTWLRHVQVSSLYPRLFRPERLRYERSINPVSVPDGVVGLLNGYIDHFPFSKGIRHWVDRHNQYSDLEAKQLSEQAAVPSPRFAVRNLIARDVHVRRAQQKRVFSRLPGRPLLKFLLLYVVKRGFLDGPDGFRYSVLQSFYEYMIVLKTREIAQSKDARVRP